LVVFFPWVRRDKTAAFWFAVMVLAVIPAATVMPLSKNLGFVAVGAYGLIASFVAGLITRRLPEWLAYRILAWVACVLLILMHVPGAIAGRVAMVRAVPSFM
jgi:K+-transporting ATPase A subunit